MRFAPPPSHVSRRSGIGSRPAYSLVELLVVMSIVVLLTGMLLPTLASVRDAANRVISKSNQRNIGQGISLYADAFNGNLPPSEAVRGPELEVGELMRAWSPDLLDNGSDFSIQRKHAAWLAQGFDGLGHLVKYDFISDPEVFYSPGHSGAHGKSRYETDWRGLANAMTVRQGHQDVTPAATVYTNYHYAGNVYWNPDSDGGRPRERLFSDPSNTVLVSDGLRRGSDLNFEGGINVLRMDLSVEWIEDWKLAKMLPQDGSEAIDSGTHAQLVWNIFTSE